MNENVADRVLLLHSSGMSGRQWSRTVERLRARGYDAVAPDLLGYGKLPAVVGDEFDIRADVEALFPLVDGAPLRVHVVGHSYGALLALFLAAARPGRVISLAAYDPVAFGVLHDRGDAEGLSDLDVVAKQPVFLDDARGGDDDWLRAFVEYWSGAGAWDGMAPPARAAFQKTGRKSFLEVRSLMRDRTTVASWREKLTMPTLLLTGEKTPRAASRVVEILAPALANGRLHVVPGAGHMGPLTHASLVSDAIEAHVAAATG